MQSEVWYDEFMKFLDRDKQLRELVKTPVYMKIVVSLWQKPSKDL